MLQCVDGSDELNCSCKEDEFQCRCYQADPIRCSTIQRKPLSRCILFTQYHDGNIECLDGSDESQYENIVQCENCVVTINRQSHVEEYNKVSSGLDEFSNTSSENLICYKNPSLNCSLDDCNNTDIICMSLNCTLNVTNHPQKCKTPFQCDDGSLLLTNNFCDGKYDCPDFSDEVLSGPGFKCPGISGICVLPQHNLYDNISQCSDGSDLYSTIDHFRCLDNRLLISSNQVCNGIFDCYDLSDECLCQINVGNNLCNSVFPTVKSSLKLSCDVTNKSKRLQTGLLKVLCDTKASINASFHGDVPYVQAIRCDGRPECRDYSDECDCENPPAFCNDSCHEFYPMGDRYCDGINDEAWKFINKSICPEGFDEENCPNTFRCKAGKFVSIDIIKRCDGINDCDAGEDEEGCDGRILVFSSDKEMIANVGLKACFWIMGFAVISGNFYVIITSLLYFKSTKDNKGVKLQRLIIFNISLADVIMGVYLLIISVSSAVYSGFYGKVDHEWRSSLRCSIIGSLTILSSETSCLMMVLLTTFRLQQVLQSFKTPSMRTRHWKAGIILAWFVSAIIAILPIFLDYFVQEIWFPNIFMHSATWDKANITNFACRLAQLTNTTITDNGEDWESTKTFLENNFPEYAPKGEFGYYGETSICMPIFYASAGNEAWEYSIFIMTMNCISFLYIAISYVYLFKRTTKQTKELQNQARVKEDKNMQKRIAFIILTDFLCWIPICITAYVKIAGYEVPNDFYIYSAVLLLPINSALNPLLFSPIIMKSLGLLCKNVKQWWSGH